ncbi:MAG: proline dehydrogenase family protein [Bellilinea sp.]
MLRAFFIFLSKADWAQRIITNWKFAWRMASRFIAGETQEDALDVVRQLNQQGILATLDHLGENTEDQKAAEQFTNDVLSVLAAIHTAGLKSNVSIKLSQLGLVLDPEMAYANLTRILDHARQYQNFIRVDMEDSSLTEITLDLVYRSKAAGYDNVGTVIQSYLYRSEDDVNRLVQKGIKVRLVKGAYKEPSSVAYPKKADVDAAFDRLTKLLLSKEAEIGFYGGSGDGLFPPLAAVASHDVKRIRFAREMLKQLDLPEKSVEFQFLYGIRRDLQQELNRLGYPVRVYVPYGTHWYPYYMRRLAERPSNVWFFISNFFQK